MGKISGYQEHVGFRLDASNVSLLNLPPKDVECLALLRRQTEETKTAIARSRALVKGSRDAIAVLDRLQKPHA